jgi:hypothetical protein
MPLQRLAEQIRKQEPNLDKTLPFGGQVQPGLRPCPSLVLEDHSWIELFEALGDVSYSYRACAKNVGAGSTIGPKTHTSRSDDEQERPCHVGLHGENLLRRGAR